MKYHIFLVTIHFSELPHSVNCLLQHLTATISLSISYYLVPTIRLILGIIRYGIGRLINRIDRLSNDINRLINRMIRLINALFGL